MKIYYQVSRFRLGWGAIPASAFLHSRLNYWNAASDVCVDTRTGTLIRQHLQATVDRLPESKVNSLVPVGSGTERKLRDIRSPEVARLRGAGSSNFEDLFHLLKISRFFVRYCEILKQLADRIKYISGEDNSHSVEQTLAAKSRRLSRVELELSESEAKFFLDRNSGRENIDRKFFGDCFERAKFHLQAFGNLLNWRSYVSGWVGVSLYVHESARLRKAESPKQGLSTLTNHQHQASGKKRLLGFFLFPADMEESDLKYELESEERGRKGVWSYCVII